MCDASSGRGDDGAYEADHEKTNGNNEWLQLHDDDEVSKKCSFRRKDQHLLELGEQKAKSRLSVVQRLVP